MDTPDHLNLIKSFLSREIFVLKCVNKYFNSLEEKCPNIIEIKISELHLISKFPYLKFKLDLRWTNVCNVSALGTVHTLDLSCTKVTDVSALGNVHTLDLCGTNVSDVSALGIGCCKPFW